MSSLARPWLLRALLLAAFAFTSCGSSCGIYSMRQKPSAAKLRVVAQPSGASVYINERFLASAKLLNKKPAKLKPGKKRITIQARGHFPHDVEVDLPSGLTTIEIKLRQIPP